MTPTNAVTPVSWTCSFSTYMCSENTTRKSSKATHTTYSPVITGYTKKPDQSVNETMSRRPTIFNCFLCSPHMNWPENELPNCFYRF